MVNNSIPFFYLLLKKLQMPDLFVCVCVSKSVTLYMPAHMFW